MGKPIITKDAISSLVQKVYTGQLAKTLLEISPAYASLQRRNLIEPYVGNEIRWPMVSSAYAGVTNISDGEDLPAASSEEYGDAYLQYSIFIGMIRVGRLLQMGAKNEREFFTFGGLDIVKGQVDRVIQQIARNIHLQLVQTSSSAKQLTGLGDAIMSTTNTYAGISRAAYTNWQPYVNENGGTDRSLTEDHMRDMHNTLLYSRGAVVDEIWAGLTAFAALADLLGGDSRIRQLDAQNLKGGTLTIDWEGIPVIRMPNLDTNAMLWLDFTSGDGIKLLKQHADQDFLVRPESTNSYDDRISIAGHYQLKVHNPFRQGALLDVN